MSIKDLFNNPGTPKIQKSVSSDDLVITVESKDFVESKRKQRDQFIPPIDFTTASNFAKFGSAELYYEKSFERIHNYYPYDGSLHEKVEFENSSSYLDKYVLEYLYPRTNGYMTFNGSDQYIEVLGGIHTASSGMIGKPLDTTFDLSMKFDESKKRTSAFEFRGDDGITVEFWFKAANLSGHKNIFHVSGANSGEIKLEQQDGDFNMLVGNSDPSVSNFVADFELIITDTEWNHYAVSVLSASNGLTAKSYKNGQLFEHQPAIPRNIPHILPQSGGLNMRIARDWQNTANRLEGSLDEFRYWKVARTPEQIFNNWFLPIGGGSNNHDANVSLGAYFKFNEGITGIASVDKTVLDYSGRINNGIIEGYVASMRNTGSAIREKLSEPEFLDPIIYSFHPDVVSKKAEYKNSGSISDLESTSLFFNYFPGWMQEEDEENGGQLKNLSQVIGSYFDTVWHQINFIDKIHNNYYVKSENKPLPFSRKILENKGFVVPDLFVEANIIESLRRKDDNQIYEKELFEIKNTIYHNIYSNLDAIYKSKGTEKSFRNLFRSIGIGQDIVKLRMYADDSTFVLRNNYEFKSCERKYLNFNYPGQTSATIYQTSSANNSNIYIPGDKVFTGSFTVQTEIVLPRKQRKNEPNYNPYPFLTASIAGYHTTGSSGYTHPTSPNGLQIYVIHSSSEGSLNLKDKQRAKFVLSGSNINLETDWFSNQYENNKWSIAARLKHSTYPTPNIIGSTKDDYLLEFYGVEADGNTERNSFLLTTSSIAHTYYSSDKIFYVGAHRENFTGSTTLHNSDVKLGYLRYWHSYLSNEAIRQHAFDPETFGTNKPFEQDLVDTYPVEVPREKTLAFHWAFYDITSSDSSGRLVISDLSSGSLDNNYGSLSNTIQRYVEANGLGFSQSSTKVVDKMYISSAKKRLPSDLMSSDLTTIKSEETEQFFVDDDVSDNFYSFEKSMWSSISDEMMNIFSTAVDFNNLIGQPNLKYHQRYNMLDFLRDRFFDDVENEPDLEKYISFYKWIDDSISVAIQQLVPASARFSEKINNVIESHVLERNKYVHKLPLLTDFKSTEGSIKGHAEMNYNWRFGHAPLDGTESDHVLWQRERNPKSDLRETIRVSRNNHSLQSSGLTRREIDGSTRLSDTYSIRKLSKTYNFKISSNQTIHGGINFKSNKNLQLFHESIAPAGPLGQTSGVPQNVITVGVGQGQGIIAEQANNDLSPRKKILNTNALIGNREGREYGYNVLGDTVLPLNIMSGSVKTGFNKLVDTFYREGSHFANLHHDTVGNHNETSTQSPFTAQHVGGLQYRHIDINKGGDSSSNRPEGWFLALRDHPVNDGDADGAFGFVGADYADPYPSPGSLKATRYREEHAKRPVNIKNIKTISGSQNVGNYKNEIELFSISPTFQKTWAINAYDDPNVQILPTFISSALPLTTHYQTLMGIAPYLKGNIFGGGTSGNRQPDVTSVVRFFTHIQAKVDLDLNISSRIPLNNSGGVYRIERVNYAANSGADETRAILIRWHNGDANGTILRDADSIRITINFTNTGSPASDWAATLANLQSTINNSPDVGPLIQISKYDASNGQFTIEIAGLLGSAGNGGTFSPLSAGSHFDGGDTTFAGGTTASTLAYSNDNVITIPRTDLTGSQRNILTRFSAPGGPEVQSIGYLDAYTTTYSVHNAMPFRNTSVLGSGSGEQGTIRVEDHLGLRRGLRTLRALHMGQFGIDSQYGSVTEENYPSSGSFNKQHRNRSRRMEYSGSSIITGSNYDNSFINSPIPRSEFQYSWINSAISGAAGTATGAPTQTIVGYAPRDGIVSSSVGFVEAIVFPSASSIFGSL